MKRFLWTLVLVATLNAATDFEALSRQAVNDLTPTLALVMSADQMNAANTLGGFPHWRVGIASSFTRITYQNPAQEGEENSVWLPYPYLYAQVGLYGGMSFTPLLGGVGSVDLVGRFSTLSFLNNLSDNILQMPTYWAAGARVGILRDRLWSPAVSVTVLYGNITPMEVGAYSEEIQDTVRVKASARATAVYLSVSKNLLLLEPYLGIGYVSGAADAQFRLGEEDYQDLAHLDSPSLLKTTLGVRLSVLPLVSGFGEVTFAGPHTVFGLGLNLGF